MISKMEKFINLKQLDVVKTGTSTADGSAALTLTDSGALFQQSVLVNAIVWDRTTNASGGGHMYLVTAVTSNTELALLAIGGAPRGGGVPSGVSYFIYMPEYTVASGGVTDGVQASGTFQLIDTSENFSALGVKIGDTAKDITSDVLTTVLGITTTTNPNDTLTVSADTFLAGDTYIIYREGANDFDSLIRSSDVSFVENTGSNTNNSEIKITYQDKSASQSFVSYAFSSSTVADESMRNGLQTAVVASQQTPWPNVTYDFPGVMNTTVTSNNDGWLAGQNFFILRVAETTL
jgi:hypothetical protein